VSRIVSKLVVRLTGLSKPLYAYHRSYVNGLPLTPREHKP